LLETPPTFRLRPNELRAFLKGVTE